MPEKYINFITLPGKLFESSFYYYTQPADVYFHSLQSNLISEKI